MDAYDLLGHCDRDHKLNLDSFRDTVRDGLQKLMKKLHQAFAKLECRKEMENWRDKPHEMLRNLIGCAAQCPFCGEQCDMLDELHSMEFVKHMTVIHRPACIRGYTHDMQMEAGNCPYLVGTIKTFSNVCTGQNPCPFKDYQLCYPDWFISPDYTSHDSLYWQSFVARYKDNLARYYGCRPPLVPSSWLNITKEELKKHLQRLYHL